MSTRRELSHEDARSLLIESATKVRDSIAHELAEVEFQLQLMVKGEHVAPVKGKTSERTPLGTEEMIRCAEYMLSAIRATPFNMRTDLLMKYSIDLAVAAEREGKQ